MTQQKRLTHEQHNEQDNQEMIKQLLSAMVYDKMKRQGSMVKLDEIEEYCN